MTAPMAWLLGESCPDCDLPLTLLDDGTSPGGSPQQPPQRFAPGVSRRPGETLFFGDTAASVLERSDTSNLFVAS